MPKSNNNNRSADTKSKSELRRLIQRYQRLAIAAEMRDDYHAMNKYSLQSIQLQQELHKL